VRVARAPLRDQYSEDGEWVVLLLDGRVLELGPVAAALLEALSRGEREVTELAEELVAKYGAPPGDGSGLRTVERLVEELCDHGLLLVVEPR